MASFGYKKESLSGLPEDPNNAPAQAQPQEKPIGFFARTAIHIIGAVAGALAILMGIISLFSVHFMCILSGLYLILLGFGLILMEAPICCKFSEITDKIGSWSQSLGPLIKAALYLLLPIATFFMCIGVTQILGILLIMGVGALYGIVFIGKKGDAVKMARQDHLTGGGGDQAVTMSEMQPAEKPPSYSPYP